VTGREIACNDEDLLVTASTEPGRGEPDGTADDQEDTEGNQGDVSLGDLAPRCGSRLEGFGTIRSCSMGGVRAIGGRAAGAEGLGCESVHGQLSLWKAVLRDWTSATRRLVVAVFWSPGTVPARPPPAQATDHETVAVTVKASLGCPAEEVVKV
jgi:hypothetical protein